MKIQRLISSLALIILSSSVCQSQAPALGTAAGFVLFSSGGAVGNTGANSQFTGNIGTATGAVTIGVNVNGTIYSGDAVANAAASDVLLAYQQLQATPPGDTFFTGSAYVIGHGDTIRAGVDSITLNAVLDSTLILDGQGNPAAVFIFKINGTFSSTATGEIVLINGALACNVFWQVNGAVSMVPNTIIRGTMITNSAAINLASGVVMEGRALTSTAGAITATNVLTYVPTGCGSPFLTGPAAPVLGTAACYALFTGNGENTNAGISNITGDVGTNVGLTTGYDPLLVNGTIHPVPDSWTAQCAADLGVATTYLNNLPDDIQLLYPALFGRNLVLTPHTYIMQGAAALTDTLFLNAKGNNDAVFVIKINGALSTSTFATVVLMNGTQAKNVYWKVNGAISISDYSVVKGTFIANTGAVNLGTGVNVEGRVLTTNGAFTPAAVTVAIPPGTCNSIVLPLTWLYFRGKAVRESVLLEWGTTREMNNGGFTIERSSDARNFQIIGSVKALRGTTGENNYSFRDEQPYPTSYYRISQTDIGSDPNYYSTIQVKTDIVRKPTVYVKGAFLHLSWADAEAGSGTVVMYSMDGRKVISQPVLLTKETSTYTVEKPALSGMYLVYIVSGTRRHLAGKVAVD